MAHSKIFTHKDLIVWQKSMDLVTIIYLLTSVFPKTEQYGLTSQMRKAAVSIPSNIAEGRRRGTKKDYLSFLRTSLGSSSELETQIEIAERLQLTKDTETKAAKSILNEIQKMLSVMLRKLNPQHPSQE